MTTVRFVAIRCDCCCATTHTEEVTALDAREFVSSRLDWKRRGRFGDLCNCCATGDHIPGLCPPSVFEAQS